jgi:hypothetical protein
MSRKVGAALSGAGALAVFALFLWGWLRLGGLIAAHLSASGRSGFSFAQSEALAAYVVFLSLAAGPRGTDKPPAATSAGNLVLQRTWDVGLRYTSSWARQRQRLEWMLGLALIASGIWELHRFDEQAIGYLAGVGEVAAVMAVVAFLAKTAALVAPSVARLSAKLHSRPTHAPAP